MKLGARIWGLVLVAMRRLRNWTSRHKWLTSAVVMVMVLVVVYSLNRAGYNKLNTEFVGTLVPVFCVLLGFVCSGLFTWYQDRKSDEAQAESVRTILETEIKLNTRTLRKFWQDLNRLFPKSKHGALEGRQQLNIAFFSGFERVAFESQLPLLAKALDKPKVLRVLQFYGDLNDFEAMRTRLLSMRIKDDARLRELHNLWHRYEQLTDHLLTEGNSLETLTITSSPDPSPSDKVPAAGDEGDGED